MKVCWRLFFLGCAIAFQSLLLGCGGARGTFVPVQGRVTLAEKPLVGGNLTFVPIEGKAGGPRPEAEIDAEGNYTLKTGGRAGAPVGKYRATLTISGKDPAQSSQFNPIYGHWEKSPLIVDVSANATAGAYDLKLLPRE